MSRTLIKEQKEKYIKCDRCGKDNFKSPGFWGCPRGSCDVEVVGTIYKITKAVEI